MSRREIGRAALAVVIGFTVLGLTAPADSQPGVTIQLFQFRPGRLEVKTGTRLTWTNQDDIAHTVTSGTPDAPDGRFDLGLAGRGASGAIGFDRAGVYPYFCSRHQAMRGEIQVN